MNKIIQFFVNGSLRTQVKWKGFMRKIESKMTPGWELFLTILFGWAGLRWWVRGRVWVGLRFLLTLGLFGLGWIFDIFICLMNYLQYLDKVEGLKKGKCTYYTVSDEKYSGEFGEKTCLYFCDAVRWFGDIDTVEMHNTDKYCNDILDYYPVYADTDEFYRLRFYILKDRVIATNVEGLEFEYYYDDIVSVDIYSDVFNIKGKDNYIYTVRYEDTVGKSVKDAFDCIQILRKM